MSKLLTTPPLHGSLHGQPTTQLSLHPPVFNIQQPPSPRRSLPSSRGQIHLFLIQARGLHVLSPQPCPYVVVQFEHNEFVSRGPSHDSDLPSNPFWKHHVSLSVHLFLSFFSLSPFSSSDVTSQDSLITCMVYDRAVTHPGFLGSFKIKPPSVHDLTLDHWFKSVSPSFFFKPLLIPFRLHPIGNEPVSGEVRIQVSFEQYKVCIPSLPPSLPLSHPPPRRPVDLSPHEISNFLSSLASAPSAKFSRSAKSTQDVYTP